MIGDMLKEIIQNKIFEIDGHRVMFDFDLSALYSVETRTLKQAVRRNIQRFPRDFLIKIRKDQWKELITICDKLPETVKHNPVPPFAFTEQGIAMLSSILKSEKAIQVNIAIMRAFVFIRQYALNHRDLTEKLDELEKRYNKKFQDIYEAINYLLKKDKEISDHQNRKRIGFKRDSREG
jgi:hypothetical protein